MLQSPYRSDLVSEGAASIKAQAATVAALLLVYWLLFQIIYFTHEVVTPDGSDTLTFGAFFIRFIAYTTQPVEIAIVSAGAALCGLGYVVLRSLARTRLWIQLLVAALFAVSSALCFSLIVGLLCAAFGVPWPELTTRFLVRDTLRWIAPFGLWFGIALTVAYNIEVRARDRRLAALQVQAQDAQLRALRYQVNPHFLYNTLNSIAALILDGRNEVAETMVVRLARFFRATLAGDPTAEVTLAEEVALQRLYLDIEQARFADTLRVDIDVDERLASARIPGLILQPLVENALKHGAAGHSGVTQVRLSARQDGSRLLLEVADDARGRPVAGGTGVGLANIQRRLAARYGTAAKLEAGSLASGGFLARISIPLSASQ